MGHRLEDLFLDPLAVEEHALLVAARAEIAGLEGEDEEVVVPAGVAPDAGEAVVGVAALDEALDHLLFDRAPDASGAPQFLGMARGALPQGTGPGVARPAEAPGAAPASARPAAWRCPCMPGPTHRGHGDWHHGGRGWQARRFVNRAMPRAVGRPNVGACSA